jgi:hypothetical protein
MSHTAGQYVVRRSLVVTAFPVRYDRLPGIYSCGAFGVRLAGRSGAMGVLG